MADEVIIETVSTEVIEVGTPGPQGATGQGVPIGGTTGQVLRKASGTNYDTEWATGGAGGGVSSWNDLEDKPATFPPSSHSHPISEVTNLQTSLDGKAATSHSHSISDVTSLQTSLDGKAATGHSHAISDVTGLQTAIDGKQASGSYAAATHSHAIGDVTGLQTALDGKQASGSYAAASHTHTPSEVGLGNVSNTAQVTSVTGTAPIVSSGGTTPAISISAATTSAAGSMSSADKTRLDGLAAVGANFTTIDWNSGSYWQGTLSFNTTITFQNVVSGKVIVVAITGAGGFGINWPSGITWVSGTSAQPAASQTMYIRLLATSATTFVGSLDTKLGSSQSATDIKATANRIFYSDSSGQVTELGLGSSGQVLTSNGATSAPSFAAASGGGSGGTKTYATFTATDNQPPATAFATLDTRNSIAVLDFDAATDENAVFVGIMPEAASLGSGLIVRLHWMATTATSGNVRWGVQFERSNTDLDTDSFDTAVEATAAANGTSGILTTTAITVTTIDGTTAGDVFRLKVFRNADDATNDTMTGDAELVAVEVRSAA